MNIFKKKQPKPVITEINGITYENLYQFALKAFQDSFYNTNIDGTAYGTLYPQYYAVRSDGSAKFKWYKKKVIWIPANPNPEIDKFISDTLQKIVKELMK